LHSFGGTGFMSRFAAIDFETASYSRNSACAVGIVVVSDGMITAREQYFIRPPSPEFVFTYIHGLTWADVKDAPQFRKLWPQLSGCLKGVDFLAAHNASFDRSVLSACCEAGGLTMPSLPFVCTMNLARSKWCIYPTKLPDVCRKLKISLQHHQALSDAEACARIVIAAEREGWRFRG
jgi:DNA polymerase III subunit epsilon